LDEAGEAAARLRAHVEVLAGVGSRHWNMPGFASAMDYAEGCLQSWGYRTRRQPFEVGVTRPERCHNLIADPGSSSEDRWPEVIIGAHLDSIGPNVHEGGPAPGADDNASGCAIVLEAARLLSQDAEERAIRFILFGAEEIGIYGSNAYVAAMRSDERKALKAVWILDQAGLDTRPTPTVKLEGYRVRSGPLIRRAEAVAPQTGLKVEYAFRPYGSDHMPFLKAHVPTLLLIQPDDEDDPLNHTEQDTPDRLDYGHMARILSLLIHSLK
jgi:Zn-dependent M28 family amino/carboxypeptidase